MNSYLKKYGLTEFFEQEATLYNGLFLARIIEQHRDLYKVIGEQGELNARYIRKACLQRRESTELPGCRGLGYD